MSLADKLACDPNVDTAERLHRVADIIELHPDHHDQETWWSTKGLTYNGGPYSGPQNYSPVQVRPALLAADESHLCGTSCCGAGWACALAPITERVESDRPSNWTPDAERVLGLEGGGIGKYLFSADWTDRESLVAAYRALAEVPESERTVANFPQIVEAYKDQLEVPDYV